MTLHIERHGRGPRPLVMIHGWAMHGGVFAPLVEALAERCTIYLVDLPGHGYSRDSTLPLEPSVLAHAIAEQTPPAHWLGWSLGGLVALQAALALPAQVHSLLMLCATPRFVRATDWAPGNDPALVDQLAADLGRDYRATLERFMALETLGSADPRGELRLLRERVFARGEPDPRVLQQGIEVLQQTDRRADLAGLQRPSLWLAGRRDRLVHPQAMRWSAERSGGRFRELAHAGHAPFFSHVPTLAEPVLAWLADIDGSSESPDE